tara:strand:- start:2531 stop:3166 length:636 start_codon:yes stop_codon:yes gene_type:complete
MANLQDIVNRSEVGTIKPWTKAAAPAGYLLCDGAAVSRSTYADLFGIIASTYGGGDGSTTFNVPNLQGKLPQGYDGNTYNLAGTGGANTVTVSLTNNQGVSLTNNQAVTVTGSIDNTSLTTAQLASHTHQAFDGSSTMASQKAVSAFNPRRNPGNFCPILANAGSGTGHNHSHTLTGTLTGTVTGTVSGTVTGSGTNSFSPYVVVNYIIKH